jgi:nucleoside-diphosphate kinase
MKERTLVLVKPDGVQRGLIGEVIKRFERKGLKIVAIKMVKATQELANQHYDEDIENRHGKHVRDALTKYIQEVPIVAMVIEGIHVITSMRKICGSTYPNEADLGTIRGDFTHMSKEYAHAENVCYNIVHSSANLEEAEKEINIWFSQEEIFDYELHHEKHVM